MRNVSLKNNIKKIAFAFSISVSPNILDTRHFSAITFTDMHQDRTKQKAVQGRVSNVVTSVDTIQHNTSVDTIMTLVSTLNNAGVFLKSNYFSNMILAYFQ